MFKITIEETKDVKRVCGREWKVVSEKEVVRDSVSAAILNESRATTEPVYGYTPEIEKTISETTTILTQAVENLDLAKVIKAINNL